MKIIKRFFSNIKWNIKYNLGTIFLNILIFYFLIQIYSYYKKPEILEPKQQLNCDSGEILKECLIEKFNVSNGTAFSDGRRFTTINDYIERRHEICIELASKCKN